MNAVEVRLAVLESELARVKRQNRRFRTLLIPVLGLALIPLTLGWIKKEDDGHFKDIFAESLSIRRNGRTFVLITATEKDAFNGVGGLVRVYNPDGVQVGQLDGLDKNGGRLSINGPSAPPHSQLIDARVGPNGFADISLHGGAVSMFADKNGVGRVDVQSRASLSTDGKGNGLLDIAGSDGRIVAKLEAVPKIVIAPIGFKGNAAPNSNSVIHGGGGRLTLNDVSGNASFTAPKG
jgi:hypothetical protein